MIYYKKFLLLLICASFFTGLSAQKASYEDYACSYFVHPYDQKFRDYKSASYNIVIEPLVVDAFSNKNAKIADTFHTAFNDALIIKELEQKTANGDFKVFIDVRKLYISNTVNDDFWDTRTSVLQPSVTLRVTDRKNVTVYERSFEEQVTVNFKPRAVLKLKGTLPLDGANELRAKVYVLKNFIGKVIGLFKDKYVASRETNTLTLPFVYRAKKKYPQYVYFDSINIALKDTLEKVNLRDYSALIKPFVERLKQGSGNATDDADKTIKQLTYEMQANLYLIAQDYDNYKINYDAAYQLAPRVFGITSMSNALLTLGNKLKQSIASGKLPAVE
jgi:hypothetical protein